MVVVTAIPFFVFDTFETPGGGPSFRLKLQEAGLHSVSFQEKAGETNHRIMERCGARPFSLG